MPSYVRLTKQVAKHSLSFHTVDCLLVTDKPVGSSFVPWIRWQARDEMQICNRSVFTRLSDTPHCWGLSVPG